MTILQPMPMDPAYRSMILVPLRKSPLAGKAHENIYHHEDFP